MRRAVTPKTNLQQSAVWSSSRHKAIVPQLERWTGSGRRRDVRTDPDFAIAARTDALAVEGVRSTGDRPRPVSVLPPRSQGRRLIPEAIQ